MAALPDKFISISEGPGDSVQPHAFWPLPDGGQRILKNKYRFHDEEKMTNVVRKDVKIYL